MDRREAIAALVALPEIARISSAPVQPTDVIVVECDRRLSQEECRNIHATLTDIWPNRRIVICDVGIRLKVVAQ